MSNPLYYLACLSIIDGKRDDLNEEFGDLPIKVAEAKKKSEDLKALTKETESIIKELKNFLKNSKTIIQEHKTKEEKLAKQQFLVRNNKEFDAITKEIEHIRSENIRINDELRNSGTREENLMITLETQKADLIDAEKEYKELDAELKIITDDQNEEVKELTKARNNIVKHISNINLDEYARIRQFHRDAVVKIKKNSCSGCYSHVPPQKIVEIRNNIEKLFTCEHCGRILFPEEIEIDKQIINL